MISRNFPDRDAYTVRKTLNAKEDIKMRPQTNHTGDVDDLILNVCGAALGYWLFYLTHRRTPLSSNPPSEMNPAKGTKNEIQAENR